ncbi:hypothetical protein DFP94_1102 [Fontibacillus phaseoli]|uniref:Uncharacterized protein n=1 Tax=Fontibacillus phaseoli TaxID=1416533 RepID=A0A369B5Z7_9BACL|nr:hypothetical protein DFP94_1102 [Fontibacillus phaseoli]
MVEALEVSFQRILQALKEVIETAGKEQLETGVIQEYETIMNQQHLNNTFICRMRRA